MDKENYIVSFNTEVEDDDFGLVEARNLLFSNIDLHEHKIGLAEYQILLMKNLFTIINDINQSMIGIHEDDIIYSQEIQLNCLSELHDYVLNLTDGEEKKIAKEVIVIFQYAISNKKNIYFLF